MTFYSDDFREPWQERRRLVHRQGRHKVAQIDCQLCAREGRLNYINGQPQPSRPPPDPVPSHLGQHADCVVCEVIR
jgi:hypothetical protein